MDPVGVLGGTEYYRIIRNYYRRPAEQRIVVSCMHARTPCCLATLAKQDPASAINITIISYFCNGQTMAAW